MILNIYTVKDKSANFCFPPFNARSHVEASRMFKKLMQDPNRSGAMSEYQLLYLATFDDQTATVVPETPFVLEDGANLNENVNA